MDLHKTVSGFTVKMEPDLKKEIGSELTDNFQFLDSDSHSIKAELGSKVEIESEITKFLNPERNIIKMEQGPLEQVKNELTDKFKLLIPESVSIKVEPMVPEDQSEFADKLKFLKPKSRTIKVELGYKDGSGGELMDKSNFLNLDSMTIKVEPGPKEVIEGELTTFLNSESITIKVEPMILKEDKGGMMSKNIDIDLPDVKKQCLEHAECIGMTTGKKTMLY